MEIQNIQNNILRGDDIMEEKSFYVSPPSSTSSPVHEFSFVISLHQQPPSAIQDKLNPQSPPSFSTALDLSPADNIFFHGHLLPLHLLSHFPVISPRSSTNSIDSFTLPETDITLEEGRQIFNGNISFQGTENTIFLDNLDNSNTNTKVDEGRIKSKSFSLFSLSKWQKSRQSDIQKNDQETKQNKKKLKFDVVSHALKKYIRMVRMSFRSGGSRRSSSSPIKRKFHQQPHSFSGSTSSRYNQHKSIGRRRGQFSAPASLRTSPANSGPLVGNGGFSTPTSESSMEELQAAITHCKNSIAMDDKKINNCQN